MTSIISTGNRLTAVPGAPLLLQQTWDCSKKEKSGVNVFNEVQRLNIPRKKIDWGINRTIIYLARGKVRFPPNRVKVFFPLIFNGKDMRSVNERLVFLGTQAKVVLIE